jgi:hypothetical protein
MNPSTSGTVPGWAPFERTLNASLVCSEYECTSEILIRITGRLKRRWTYFNTDDIELTSKEHIDHSFHFCVIMQNILLWHDGLYVCPSLEHLNGDVPAGRSPADMEAKALIAREAVARKLRDPATVLGEDPAIFETEREKHDNLRRSLIENFAYRTVVKKDLPWIPPGYKGFQ